VGLSANVPTSDCRGSSSRIIEESLNRVVLEVSACGEGLVVLSGTYYPGWQARLDGEEVPILRTNHLARGVAVGAGTHSLEFLYRPASFRWGALLTLLATLASLGLCWRGRRT
jgi:uncharacterized membrane protein YfhO